MLANVIGTNATGTAPLGNAWGVVIGGGAQNNTIGGQTETVGNLISGNTEAGIQILGSGTSDNQVLGNYIGVDATKIIPLGNYYGILIGDGAQDNLVGGAGLAGNLISGNTNLGIQLQDSGTTGNQVLGNVIGTDPTGTTSLGNWSGVGIGGGAQNNVIGGTGSGRNLISGNTHTGMVIEGEGTTSNQVLGNYIGTNLTGTAELGNFYGVLIGLGAENNVIGGTGLARNLISGNTEAGIQIEDEGTAGNQVLGNYIGTDLTGTASLGNKTWGVLIGGGPRTTS